ncbi:MAG: type 4a pilus biogenesis protein PilO [Gallionellaceae bacterium]
MHTLSRIPHLIGWVGGLGVSLIGAALITFISLTAPQQNENDAIELEINAMQDLLREPRAVSGTHQQLNDFIDKIPTREELNNALNQLHKLAAQHHLSLKNSEYHPSPNQTGQIQQLRITVKTEGEYTNLRLFLEEISSNLPTLAITKIALGRQKISEVRLDTTIEFILYFSQPEQPRL